jgi:hypothetical protein
MKPIYNLLILVLFFSCSNAEKKMKSASSNESHVEKDDWRAKCAEQTRSRFESYNDIQSIFLFQDTLYAETSKGLTFYNESTDVWKVDAKDMQ